MKQSVQQVQRIALDGALDEANSGRPPLSQDRDPRKLVRVVCAWCGDLLRYEVWPESEPGTLGALKGGEPLTSHGICPTCMQQMEVPPMASMTSDEYWYEQRRLARIEEKLDRALEENRQLELGLAEQGQISMELRAQVQRLEAAFATIVARTKEAVTDTN